MNRNMYKRNSDKMAYEPYSVPDSWNTPLVSNNMDEIINCANCGKELKFGDGYTSRIIHTRMGFGYCICKACEVKEIRQAIQNRKEEFESKETTELNKLTPYTTLKQEEHHEQQSESHEAVAPLGEV